MEELQNDIVIYNPFEDINLEVRVAEDTVWLTQAQMVILFQSSKSNVSEHLKNIYSQQELDYNATVRNFRTVQNEGTRSVTRTIAS